MVKFSCLTCQRPFKHISGLDSHCCTNLHIGLWECCGAKFYCRAHCDQHVASDSWHTNTTDRTCDACQMTFHTVEKFNRHKRRTHARPAVCTSCTSNSNAPSGYAHGSCDDPSCGIRTHGSQPVNDGGEIQGINVVEPGPPLNAREQRTMIDMKPFTAVCNDSTTGRRWIMILCPSCSTVLSSIAHLREHEAAVHDIVTLVSPRARKLKKKLRREAAKEQRDLTMTEQQKAAQKAAAKQRKLQKKLEAAERMRQEQERKIEEEKQKKKDREQRKKELKSHGPVACVVCSRKFATPGDYAQHLESGTHREIKRYHVTQAVHMLDVVPPITLAPALQYFSPPESEGYTTSTITPFSSVPSSPIGEASLPGSPLHGSNSSLAGSVVLASSVSSEMFFIRDTAFPIGSPFEPTITYTPDDFVNLGIPYACALCCKTFRTVVQLTAHMNSPVHDPDAFKCPGPKCGQRFALVSGLIRHLESGRCNLASAGEIFERFALLTAKFSKYLTA